MRRTLPFIAIAALLAAGAYTYWPRPTQAAEITVYRDPSCGCCEAWSRYMEQKGYSVSIHQTSGVTSLSRKAGIADDAQGCHLAYAGDYVISGMVPVEAVKRLLTQHPKVAGITLPGMPSGAPGMGGSKSGPLTVYAIGRTSKALSVYWSDTTAGRG